MSADPIRLQPVAATVRVEPDGSYRPLSFTWPDGREYRVYAMGAPRHTADPQTGRRGLVWDVSVAVGDRRYDRRMYRFGGVWSLPVPVEREWLDGE